MRSRYLPLLAAPLALAACQQPAYDPRGVDHDETLLSVSATGESEVRPDEAFFQVGVENFGPTGKAASDANAKDIAKVVAALRPELLQKRGLQDPIRSNARPAVFVKNRRTS